MQSANDWMTSFLERVATGLDINRMTTAPSRLSAESIVRVLGDPQLGSHAVEALSDLMHPTGSMYYDAVFGAFHGQVAIRNWLVPTMKENSFIEFVPTASTEVFARDRGTSSIDEWQMWAHVGAERLPLSRGVSTRHYDADWITWNADVYDTGPMRRRLIDPDGDAAPLPDPPRAAWESDPMVGPDPSPALQAWLERPPERRGRLDHADIHTIMTTPELGLDPDIVGPLWHETESRLYEPTADFAGGEAIRAHLNAVRDSRVATTLERIGPAMFNGHCTAFEWVAHVPDEGSVRSVRGTSVCRYADGWIIHAADYYDTAARS